MKLGRLGTYALAAAVLTACTTTNVSVQGEPVRLAPGSAIAVSASAVLAFLAAQEVETLEVTALTA